ncbi:Acetyl esterase Axe7A [bioreactor metagenome]|uniref:Acetyl esterase Axe7A n=1 Tax=bioreactor metagenome TaxID=1076179 RepID=A0A645ATF7_9ZZZZ
MKRWHMGSWLLVLLLAAQGLAAAPRCTGRMDRKSALYQPGETAKVTLLWSEDKKPLAEGTFTVAATVDGMHELTRRSFDLAQGNPAVWELPLNEPGIVQFEIVESSFGGKGVAAAAAIAPDKLALPAERFDPLPFWQKARADFKAKATITRRDLPQFSDAGRKTELLVCEVGGKEKFYAFWCRPAAPGQYPLLVNTPSHGMGPFTPALEFPRTDFVPEGVMTLAVNIHRFPPQATAAAQKAAFDKIAGYYFCRPGTSIEDYYFTAAVLAIQEFIDYVAQQPECDSRHIVAAGSSQGGGLTLISAAINPKITAAAVNVPAFCDFSPASGVRMKGWPVSRSGFDQSAETAQVMRYFDAGNLAAAIKVPVVFSAGYFDRVCPANGIYAVYHAVPGEKSMYPMPISAHVVLPGYLAVVDEFIRKQLK